MRWLRLVFCVGFTVNLAHAADVQTISGGERVDIEAHLAPGKLTLIDFYADWCGPCRSLAPTLERLAAQYEKRFALRKIDITQAGSPAGDQYGVRAIPYLILFDENGRKIREGNTSAVLRELENRLGIAGGRSPRGGLPRGTGDGVPVTPFVVLALVAVGIALYLRQSRASPHTVERRPLGGDPASAPIARGEAGWFAMIQNSLEGPFSIEDLEQMLKGRILPGDARVRRRGDAQWQKLDDVIGA